jgi:hypothetical protein
MELIPREGSWMTREGARRPAWPLNPGVRRYSAPTGPSADASIGPRAARIRSIA